MNLRTIRASRAALSLVLGAIAGPALAGLDFTPPQLPQERQAAGPSATSPDSDARAKADLPALRIAPGVTLSPDLDAPSPNAIVDPTVPRHTLEPMLRLQVPIPP